MHYSFGQFLSHWITRSLPVRDEIDERVAAKGGRR